jgi:hypothetical protein
MAGLGCGLKVKAEAVETTAFRHGTPNRSSFGKIIHIVSDHYVGIKRVPALPTIAVDVV